MSDNVAIYAVIFVVAITLFFWTIYRRFGLLLLGRPENRFDNLGRRFWNMLVYAFGQRKVVSKPFGINHFVLFWCFMILLAANTAFLFSGLFPDYINFSKLPTGLYFALAFLFDIISALALAAVIAALVRRAFFAPPHIGGLSRDAVTILVAVAVLMIAYFGLHGSEIAQGKEAAARFMPVSSLAAMFLSGASASVTSFFWWVHAIVLLAFLNYLPYSKHMHILTAIPNCFFRRLGKANTQPREEFKKGNLYGVGRVDQFTWKGLFDAYACTECGRCSDACPATFTGKPLDPQKVVHDIKANLLKNGPLIKRKKAPGLSLIGLAQKGSIEDEVIWECTTCYACVEVCPVFIEQFPRIIDMRRNLVEIEARFPEQLLTFFENMEQRYNPYGMAAAERTKWATEIEVKPFEAGKTEYLFWVGCVGAFNARNRVITGAIAKILNTAGVSWGTLGREEKCCGDSLRRLGNEYVFDRFAKDNIQLFEAKGVKKVITECPHCCNVFKNDYLQYGVELEVYHHTVFIDKLLKEGKLKLSTTKDWGKVLFHDSCYLGRYNDIYDQPRWVVAQATGQQPTEMKRHHNQSFCCGGGGGRMWMEEIIGKRINTARVEEALSKDPQTICVCCPYCMTMFEDGLKDRNLEEKVRVFDVAEIVAWSLK